MDEALSKVLVRLDEIADALARQRDEWRQWRTGHDAVLADLRRRVDEMEDARRLAAQKSMSVCEAARYSGVEPATVRRWLADGRLRGTKKGGVRQSRWRIRRQELDAFLERATNSPRSSVLMTSTTTPPAAEV